MQKDLFSLEGKTVFITGGSSGIGEASAHECANAGARVIISGRNRERLDDVLASLKGEGHSALVADITCDADIERIIKELPALDGFAHCAGMTMNALLKFSNWQDIEAVLDTNLLCTIKLSQALIKQRKINKGGSMVYISSVLASVAFPGLSAYCASKAGMQGFVRVLAVEMAARQVRANTISPGSVQTPMTQAASEGRSEESIKADLAKYPLGYGVPQDIACAVRYFLADASRWVTGTDFVIDGGMLHYR